MKAFFVHFSFEFRTGVRNKQLLLMNYLFPLGFYLMMGFILVGINPFFLESMIPGMVIFAILAATLLGIPTPLVNARENGIFRSYKINGVPIFSILIIPVLTTMLHLFIVAVIIAVTGSLLFHAPSPTHWFMFAVIFFVTAFCMSGAGVLIGVISANARLTVLYSQLLFLPSILLAGIMMPYSMLPGPAAAISRLLPSTLAMNAFVGLAMGSAAHFNPWGAMATLLAGGAVAFGLAALLFSWDRRNAKRRGHPIMALLFFLPFAVGILAG
ncbi:MAG: hypothetical protein CMN78_00200 [Spirochaetales bacterium]|nr:hypothetical protein [Spirochaetales bacterium]